MRVSEMQLYPAITEFIERELMPLGATMNLTEQFLFGFKIGVLKRKIQDVVKGYLASDGAKMLYLVDENGCIDIDTLYQSACEVMERMHQLPVMGFNFKANDLQNLYGIIQKYANS